MKVWKLGAGALATLVGVAAASSAPATTVQLQKFGRVYTMSACGLTSVRGSAHCFAKIVTDARGNIIEGKQNAAPNVAPQGKSPSDLQSAYNVNVKNGPAGYTIAIVDAYGYANAEKDMAVYRQQMGSLSACTTANGCFKKVNENGTTTSDRATTRAGVRSRHLTSTWSARCARAAISFSSRLRRTTIGSRRCGQPSGRYGCEGRFEQLWRWRRRIAEL